MSYFLSFFLFVLGLVMIIKGSDWFIDAVIWAAQVFKIPYIIIGATLVSLCTTLPETFVSVAAAVKNQTDYAFGNAIGSSVFNTGFIMGMLLLFAKPVIENRRDFIKNGFFLIFLVAATFVAALVVGELDLTLGLVLVGLLLLYLVNNVLAAKKEMRQIDYDIEKEKDMAGEPLLYEGAAFDVRENEIDISRKTITKYLIYFAVGITLVIVGSNLLVDHGIKIAELLGVPSIVIAVTFTAIGTSLPELMTAITSIRKKVTNLGVGNIIGANILNIIQVMGISSLVTPISLNKDPSIISLQLPMTMGIVVLAVMFGVVSKSGFQRWQGALLLASYAAFFFFNML